MIDCLEVLEETGANTPTAATIGPAQNSRSVSTGCIEAFNYFPSCVQYLAVMFLRGLMDNRKSSFRHPLKTRMSKSPLVLLIPNSSRDLFCCILPMTCDIIQN